MCTLEEVTKLFRECSGKLKRYAQHYLGDIHASEDAVQQAFLRLMQHIRIDLKKRQPIVNPPAWLFRTLRNICIDSLRSKVTQSTQFSERDAEDTDFLQFSIFASPLTLAEKADESQMLRIAIEQELTTREREIISLSLEEHKSYAEIAEIVGITRDNVGTLLFRAFRKLRKFIHTGAEGMVKK